MPAYEPTQAPSLGPDDRPTNTCPAACDRREEGDFASGRPVFSSRNRDDKIIRDYDLCIPPSRDYVVSSGVAAVKGRFCVVVSCRPIWSRDPVNR